MGSKETEATNLLEKKFKGSPQMSYEEAVLVRSKIHTCVHIHTCAHICDMELKGWGRLAKPLCFISPPSSVQAAIGALQNVLSEDMKPSDIEVGGMSGHSNVTKPRD